MSNDVVLKRRPLWKRILSMPRIFRMHYREFRRYGNGRWEAVKIARRLAFDILKVPKPSTIPAKEVAQMNAISSGAMQQVPKPNGLDTEHLKSRSNVT